MYLRRNPSSGCGWWLGGSRVGSALALIIIPRKSAPTSGRESSRSLTNGGLLRLAGALLLGGVLQPRLEAVARLVDVDPAAHRVVPAPAQLLAGDLPGVGLVGRLAELPGVRVE